MGVAWLFNCTLSLLLVAAASALCVGGEEHGQYGKGWGSGRPGSGTDARHFLLLLVTTATSARVRICVCMYVHIPTHPLQAHALCRHWLSGPLFAGGLLVPETAGPRWSPSHTFTLPPPPRLTRASPSHSGDIHTCHPHTSPPPRRPRGSWLRHPRGDGLPERMHDLKGVNMCGGKGGAAYLNGRMLSKVGGAHPCCPCYLVNGARPRSTSKLISPHLPFPHFIPRSSTSSPSPSSSSPAAWPWPRASP